MHRFKFMPIRIYLAAQALRDREEGQAMVEYALILSLVSIGAIGILTLIGANVTSIFVSINNAI